MSITATSRREQLMGIAKTIVEKSQGRAVLAYQEQDASLDHAADAAHFIKVGGKRVGRDIELYGFMGDGPVGWEGTLPMFLQEVLMPIKSLGLSDSYDAGGELLKQIGHQVYDIEMQTQWDELF